MVILGLIAIELIFLLWPKAYNNKKLFSVKRMREKRRCCFEPESMSEPENEECLTLINNIYSSSVDCVINEEECRCIPERRALANAKKSLKRIAELHPTDESILADAEVCRRIVKTSAKRCFCGATFIIILLSLIMVGLFIYELFRLSEFSSDVLLSSVGLILPYIILYYLSCLRTYSRISRRLKKGKEGRWSLAGKIVSVFGLLIAAFDYEYIVKEVDAFGFSHYYREQSTISSIFILVFWALQSVICLILLPIIIPVTFIQNYILQ